MQNVDTDKMHKLFYEANKEVDKIAGMFDIDEITAWSIILEGTKDTQKEIAEALEIGQPWVSKHDPEPDTYHKGERLSRRNNVFYGYNVWGFKDESWAEYTRLKSLGWTQQRIAKAKGLKSRAEVSERLKFNTVSNKVKDFVNRGLLAEFHLREICSLSTVDTSLFG